ncbi:hypothetical protein E3N88_36035 [Mikania micrantha]|uniref:Integrase zinc-binding domain-containing protein n=1 Tax=Mikania micrantha TaxID=192012 RepID=A0A5N6M2M5_9ASTR|nr:hypothetical protein E3N88_36035 [Mikania micrantha]
MALVLAVQHWRPYLLGTRFIVYTDQKSLKYLLQQRITSPDQQNWVAKLLGYNFDIQYKPGRENRVADALSRRADSGELLLSISSPVWLQGAQLIEEAQLDKEIQHLKQQCQLSPSKHPGYTLKQGVLHYQNWLVISRQSVFIPLLIKEFHMSPSGGHSGFYRTYRRLAAYLYWPGMTTTIKRFVRQRDVCQRCKASSVTPGGLLQQLPIREAIWANLSMGFIVVLPLSKGFNVIFVIVSPFPPSDKILVQKGNGCEEVIDMEKINMAWVPCNPLGQRPATLEYIELGSSSHRYFPFFDNPYKVDERRHQNSVVDIVYPTETGVIIQKFNWECHVSEGLAKRLIDAGELPRDQKDAFKKFVREKVNEGKRANREAIQQLIEAAEELSRTEVEVAAAFEKMRFYKFYPVAHVFSAKVV